MERRKPTRLKNYDYSANGYYFITICTAKKQKILCDIVGEGLCALPKTNLTKIGKCIDDALKYINENYDAKILKYAIMPNHIHFIIKTTGGHGDPPQKMKATTGGHGDPPLQDIIGRMKSFTTKQYGETLWQRSFYDHIIRDEKDYLRIWEYIDTNPQKWTEDKYFAP